MKKLLGSFAAIAAGLAVSLLVAMFVGENPFKVLGVLFYSSFGSWDNFCYTLFYSTPLIFTGLSVAIAFQAGLFNIGAEGQLYIGSLLLTWGALSAPLAPIPKIFAIILALLGGGLWGSLAGWLKAKRGAHEVIVTIMLNFISYAFCSFMILGKLKTSTNQNPETSELSSNYFLHRFSESTPLNTSIFLAIVCVAIVWFLLFKTHWGFEVRMIGSSPETARRSGVVISKRIIQAMFLSGAMASLVGVNEVLGNAHKLRDQFSPGYGFVGIAVALLARNKPFAIIASAILFGALSKGSLDLELDTEKITRDMALMIQGLIILFVASQNFWSKSFLKRRPGGKRSDS